MTITEALQNHDRDIRVTSGDRWLCWYENQWTVFECKYRQRNTTMVLQVDNEAEAVNALLGEDDQ